MVELPPDEERYKSWQEACMDDIDTIYHLRASWAWEGLAQREHLLILYTSTCQTLNFIFIVGIYARVRYVPFDHLSICTCPQTVVGTG